MIGGFQSDLSITRKTDGNFRNDPVGVLFSKVAYQQNGGNLSAFSTGMDKILTQLPIHCN